MRHIQRLSLGLVLAALMAAAPAPVDLKPGGGQAYDTLGDLAILDSQGRIKPLHTKAVETVKRIYSRQTIKLAGPDKDTPVKWSPVAAMFDWAARPDFWNDQPFILVEYLPLKQAILAEPIRADLYRIVGKSSGETKTALDALHKQRVFTSKDLKSAAALPGLSEDHRAILLGLATKLDEDHKWLSPSEIEDNEVALEGGSKPFEQWYREIDAKRRGRDEMGGTTPADKLSTLEEKAAEVGDRLMTYQSIRDLNTQEIDALDIGVVPRPVGPEYLKATAGAIEKANKVGGLEGLSPLDLDLAKTWVLYVKDIPGKDRNPPGKSEEFDRKFSAWLAETASWYPLRLLVSGDDKELAAVGFPAAKLQAFRTSYATLMKAEAENPGEVENAKAVAFIAAARGLGEGRPTYPTAAAMARESYFNKLAPFFHAPEFYGLAVALFLPALWFRNPTRKVSKLLRNLLYGSGMLMFLGGILLEVYGFYLRVGITGWAPVTNMYETVIWVALVTTVIALVIEAFTRKTYAALAGAGIALIATLLAANVPLLDSNIKTLPPVLRDNFWLSIHVLTIVSSYAAFALAMGLGLLAVGFYLTATYKRSATPAQLAMPLLAGLPTLALGCLGVYGSYEGWAPGLLDTTNGYVVAGAVAILGLGITSAGVFSLLGELANRLPAAAGALGVALIGTGLGCLVRTYLGGLSAESVTVLSYVGWITGVLGCGILALGLFGAIAQGTLQKAAAEAQRRADRAQGDVSPADWQPEDSAAPSGGVATATLTRPADTKARPARPVNLRTEVRARSMQETVMMIKPVVNFIYAAMAVGVVLVTAGTILGGVWADYSWGRFWGWDPKEVWALITLLVYLIPLHGRFAGWVNTFGLAILSVVCFSSVLMAWYGVNFILGVGLHSYGFTEGGGQGIVFACSAAVLGIAGGAWWRRSVSSKVGSQPLPAAV
jgi:ABC-type transport system involved in cytochrome c biogenesis permease subunit